MHKQKQNVLVINAGHGGAPKRIYLNWGKQSPQTPPGIYEGEFNRDIAQRVHDLVLAGNGIDSHTTPILLAQTPIDVPLKNRMSWLNRFHKRFLKEYGDTAFLYLSIHANAKGRGKKWYKKAKGMKLFVRPNDKKGASFAKWILHQAALPNRSGGLPLTQRGVGYTRWLREVRVPQMPSVLFECAFMTNKEDAAYMASEIGRDAIAKTIFVAYRNYLDARRKEEERNEN